MEHVYPVLNNDLRTELEITIETDPEKNKYKTFFNFLKSFVRKYLNNADFKKIIPLTSGNFLKVDDIKITNSSPGSNELEFGKKGKHRVPREGLINFGPFDHSPFIHNNIFVIPFHHKEQAITLFENFKKGMTKIPPLKQLIKKSVNINKDESVVFENIENPLPEIKQIISSRSYLPDTRYLAIYISPYSKDEPDPVKRQYYYQVKEALLSYNITSQVIDVEKINSPDFYLYYVNICIAILAKFNGVSWRLSREDHNELVIGVGAFKSLAVGVRYIAGAFCFSNDGHFHGFECFSETRSHMLAGPISKAIQNYYKKFPNIYRLVIHYYKQMSRKKSNQSQKYFTTLV